MPVDVENSTTCPKCGGQPPMSVQFHTNSDGENPVQGIGLSCPHCLYGQNGEWTVMIPAAPAA